MRVICCQNINWADNSGSSSRKERKQFKEEKKDSERQIIPQLEENRGSFFLENSRIQCKAIFHVIFQKRKIVGIFVWQIL